VGIDQKPHDDKATYQGLAAQAFLKSRKALSPIPKNHLLGRLAFEDCKNEQSIRLFWNFQTIVPIQEAIPCVQPRTSTEIAEDSPPALWDPQLASSPGINR
jgi:hypothetical protein